MTDVRKTLAACALVFLVTHVLWSASTLGDIDAVNFALGVRDFDVALHQPHPPGYPVFIAAAKASTAVLEAIGVPAPEVRGIALLNVIAGTLAIPLLFVLFRRVIDDVLVAGWAAVMSAVSPLLWFNSLRPLSDVAGLVIALAAQTLLIAVIVGGRKSSVAAGDRAGGHRRVPGWALIAGSAVAGLSIGVRSQNLVLTLPLVALALIVSAGITMRERVTAVLALILTVLLWLVPLVAFNGGIDGYLAALGNQAGEDLVAGMIVWTSRSPRMLASALQYSFLWPWGGIVVGATIAALAAVGVLRAAIRFRFALLILMVAYGPYAAFQLIFQETVMTRYALPLVPPIALLAVYALAGVGRVVVHAGCAAFTVYALIVNVPTSRTYATLGSPAFRILEDVLGSQRAATVGMHAVMLRLEQWYHGNQSGRMIRARHGREILSLVDRWRTAPEMTVDFMADPRRSDLAMLDSRTRKLRQTYDWGFPEQPFVGGARPSALELYRFAPPGWMLDQGWAVTAEVAGQSDRAGARPEARPSIAWIRVRPGPTTLMIGGRHLGAASAPTARVSLALSDRPLAAWEVNPGFFFKTITLPAGALAAETGYLPLSVSAAAETSGEVRLSLEQFDLQGEATPMLGLVEGWQEPEYNPITGRAWRWISARGTLWVKPIGRDVTVTLQGESPLRYFSTAPQLRMRIGTDVVAQLSPSDDFSWKATLPHHLLAAHGGTVAIESDKWFVPGGRDARGDQRQLALRIYAVHVD